MRCPTAGPLTPYLAPISLRIAGGAGPSPAQSRTDFARPLSGPNTRQMSCDTMSGTVDPGSGTPSRTITSLVVGDRLINRYLRLWSPGDSTSSTHNRPPTSGGWSTSPALRLPALLRLRQHRTVDDPTDRRGRNAALPVDLYG